MKSSTELLKLIDNMCMLSKLNKEKLMDVNSFFYAPSFSDLVHSACEVALETIKNDINNIEQALTDTEEGKESFSEEFTQFILSCTGEVSVTAARHYLGTLYGLLAKTESRATLVRSYKALTDICNNLRTSPLETSSSLGDEDIGKEVKAWSQLEGREEDTGRWSGEWSLIPVGDFLAAFSIVSSKSEDLSSSTSASLRDRQDLEIKVRVRSQSSFSPHVYDGLAIFLLQGTFADVFSLSSLKTVLKALGLTPSTQIKLFVHFLSRLPLDSILRATGSLDSSVRSYVNHNV
jgi:hypothetical protein